MTIPEPKRKDILLPDGRVITLETGKLARQANGAVVLKLGKAMLLASAVADPKPREGVDFLPLSVDYQEKFASAGRIPGSFQKREGRLSDYEVLISRLVDRAIRPMFPDDYHLDTQINIYLISADDSLHPDCLAGLAASAALAVSDIPFPEPISEVRVAKMGDQYLINPTIEQTKAADLELIVAATYENILMVEGEAKQVSEAEMLHALKVAHQAIKTHCLALKEWRQELGKTFFEYAGDPEDPQLKEMVFQACYQKFYDIAKKGLNVKAQRAEQFGAVKDEFLASLPEDHGYSSDLLKRYLKSCEKKAMRDMVLNERIRLDGRKLDEIRPIWCEVDYLPSAHGSAVFTRGETQSLTSVTIGTKLDEQIVDNAMELTTKRFLLHYNFPAFSTGEVRPNRGPGRREIGHGNLAFRALSKVMPNVQEGPYTIRIVSDILESNGSSSMATVCAGSLALMDAGIQTTAAVSGIAMGMISDSGKYAILSDILGDEDHLGDMDFKVTGTEKGITACQMDLKVDGLTYDVLEEALLQARAGRLHILDIMNQAISSPRPDFKPTAPRVHVIMIERDQIGAVIGPGGKIVQEIQRETNTTISIEETATYGMVSIFSNNETNLQNAIARVKAIVTEPEEGTIYKGTVKSLQPYGAFVEILKGKEGLLHISEVAWERLETLDGILKEGQQIDVKLLEIDKKTGKYKLSRKVLLEKPDGYVERPPREDRGDRPRDERRGKPNFSKRN
jgi:polyribonucleotide nucleotidyltransferase